jgi:hypothetical protein
MRARHLIIDEIFTQLGGVKRAAELLSVPEGTARTWEQDPGRSGREIPLSQLLKIITLAAQEIASENGEALIDELLAHFTDPAHRKLVSPAAIAELERALELIRDGASRKLRAVVPCPECGDELKIAGTIDGKRVYLCRTCTTRA